MTRVLFSDLYLKMQDIGCIFDVDPVFVGQGGTLFIF